MKGRFKITRWALLPLVLILVFSGCFSIPFINIGKGKKIDVKPGERQFARSNVFIGYDDDGLPIVELRLLSQEISNNGLVVHTRLFPTENFKVHHIFRGLRSINYYPIERRFHRLELRYGKKKLKAKVKKNLEVREQKPINADFEHTGVFSFLPDTIDMVKLKFQDVDRWGRLPPDSLDAWYARKKDYLNRLERVRRRRSLVDTYKRQQKRDYTKKFTQYDSLYVTTNNTYVYLEKDVTSDILFTLNAGDQIDYGVSDGVWMEIPLPDSLREKLSPLLEKRHQKMVRLWRAQQVQRRSRRGPVVVRTVEVDTTRRFTGYVLDVMLRENPNVALDWEKENMMEPVDVPLFAKVLRDREAARIARLDSIEKARADSIARQKQLADSLKQASAKTVDSTKVPATKKRPAASSPQQSQPAGVPTSGLPDSSRTGTTVSDSGKAEAADSARTNAPEKKQPAGKLQVIGLPGTENRQPPAKAGKKPSRASPEANNSKKP